MRILNWFFQPVLILVAVSCHLSQAAIDPRLEEITNLLFARNANRQLTSIEEVTSLVDEVRALPDARSKAPKKLVNFLDWLDSWGCESEDFNKKDHYVSLMKDINPAVLSFIKKIDEQKNRRCRKELDGQFLEVIKSLEGRHCEVGICIDEMAELKNHIRAKLQNRSVGRSLVGLSYKMMSPGVVEYARRKLGPKVMKRPGESWSQHEKRFEPMADHLIVDPCKGNQILFPRPLKKRLMASVGSSHKLDGFSDKSIAWLETLSLCKTLGTDLHRAYLMGTLDFQKLHDVFNQQEGRAREYKELKDSFENLSQLIEAINHTQLESTTEKSVAREPLGSILRLSSCTSCTGECFETLKDLRVEYRQFVNIKAYLKGKFEEHFQHCYHSAETPFQEALNLVHKDAALKPGTEYANKLDNLMIRLHETFRGQRLDQQKMHVHLPELVASFWKDWKAARRAELAKQANSGSPRGSGSPRSLLKAWTERSSHPKPLTDDPHEIKIAFEDEYLQPCAKVAEAGLVGAMKLMKPLLKADPERLRENMRKSGENMDWLEKARVCDVILEGIDYGDTIRYLNK